MQLGDLTAIPPERPVVAGPGVVDLWFVFYDPLGDELSGDYEALLTPAERARGQRFVFERHRRQHLFTRALQRSALSQYAAVDPGAWRFRYDEYGKPTISEPAGFDGLRFNLSNTKGLIACAISTTVPEIGVDVEHENRLDDPNELAEQFFSPREAADLRLCEPARVEDRFLRYWTLKESYIKARGMGMSIPLDGFSFHLDRRGPIDISFAPSLDDDPEAWSFASMRASRDHMLAVAARTGPDLELRLRGAHHVPLRAT